MKEKKNELQVKGPLLCSNQFKNDIDKVSEKLMEDETFSFYLNDDSRIQCGKKLTKNNRLH